uniref:Capsid protein n=1 Tax=Syphacia muris TaxID=451379 RepID=A0A0N5B1N3_9BILA
SDNELVPSQVGYSISPQVDVKGFDGNFAEWPAFWSRFNCAVHSTSMKAKDKFLRLQTLLKGPA